MMISGQTETTSVSYFVRHACLRTPFWGIKKAGLLALPLAAAMATAAYAQDNEAQNVDSGALAEVVVTAQKQVSTAQKTPIAIDVVTGDKIIENGITDMKSLESIAPGIQFGQTFTGSIITVRGISGRDATEIGDPAVAVNVDGVFLQRPTGMNASLFDLERIEVLRGPQGTLYGRNATGGVINIISQKPKLGEFSGYASLTYGNYEIERSMYSLRPHMLTDIGEWLDRAGNKGFLAQSHSKQTECLLLLDESTFSRNTGSNGLAEQAWANIKPLIVASYYSSEVGASEELIYEPIPGSFRNLPLTDDYRARSNEGHGEKW